MAVGWWEVECDRYLDLANAELVDKRQWDFGRSNVITILFKTIYNWLTNGAKWR